MLGLLLVAGTFPPAVRAEDDGLPRRLYTYHFEDGCCGGDAPAEKEDTRELPPAEGQFQISSLSDGSQGQLYLGTSGSGGLRLETDEAEPLPPVAVDNGPFQFQVNASGAKAPDPPPRRRPRVRLTGLRVSREGKASEGLTFSFAGIDPAICSKGFRYLFQYRLNGLEPDWRETRHCSVSYGNLQPGPYRFEVKAVDGAGRWSEPAGVSFAVLPPWWRQPLRVAGAALAGIALAGAIFAARSRRLLQAERLRATIAADLHDQMGAGLTDIAILSEVAARKAGGLPELDRVAATARELVDGMGDIVWLVNPRRDSLYELFLRLKDTCAELFAHADAQLDVDDLSPLEGVRLSLACRQDLHLLFREALRNALRHSGCRRAELTVTRRGRRLEAVLRDDGHGFDPEGHHAGQGLETMRRRAERLGGRLTIDSSPEGTIVRFTGRFS